MSHLVTRRWEPDPLLPAVPGSGMPFQYEAYVPNEIAGIDPSLSARTARLLSEADTAVRELNEDLPGIAGLEAMSRQLLRQESVASSRIEGLEMSQRRLARAAVVDDDQHRDTSAEAILANIAAMEHAISVTSVQPHLEVDALIDIHRVLMEKTRDAHIAGIVRASQNWIGGNGYNPRGAAFIPPPEDEVGRLLADLVMFMNRQDLPITFQAAVAHAQFETIHPFADGNGRTGRCLIHVVYKRGRAADRFVPPVSLVLATEGDAYIRGLTSYREDRLQDWCADFALTVIRACRAARLLAQHLAALQTTWLEQLGPARQDSSSRRLIAVVAGQPILRVQHVVELLDVGTSAAHKALNELEAAGVLKQVTVGKRNRAWEAVGLLALIDAFVRTLATPEGAAKPVRRAPRP